MDAARVERANSTLQPLLERARSALSASPIYELRSLRVEAHNGGLVISGLVQSFYYKQLAQELVRSVARDTNVTNSIDVS